ncbi:cyclodeaminase/cyclohydrolase family protein [Alicyclobacillus fodiniaquatilis]|uniref:Cyclodeaminase/cyclohydrolase family protein n=1 Tax=Alicyclobacillus fodiniaquatilis TaxID=1661150 RepID=A0ABW4JL18_9BACL
MTVFNQSIRSFIDASASAAPTPGGGSVAALVAALGASMTSMVANLTQGAQFASVEADMDELAMKMKEYITTFETLLEADMISFNRYMTAIKLPKSTAEEKAIRTEQIQAATVAAAQVPLHLAETAMQVLEQIHTIKDSANKHVLSDLGISVLLLEAAVQAALLTVDINLPGLKNEGIRTEFTQKRNFIAAHVTTYKNDLMDAIQHRMAQNT